jgi:D-alanyl-D-alanine carboxypeptidase
VGLAPDTLFSVASISQLFVATVAMQLVQEGWLSLDQTVEQWLP